MHAPSRQTRIASGESTAIAAALSKAVALTFALVLFVTAYAALLGAVA